MVPVFVRPNPKAGYKAHKHVWVRGIIAKTGEIKDYCRDCGEPKE